jgi:DNA-directed RNA polymerase subunit beta'
LVGLKENVILGHLIPAGTGFRTFQDSEVSYRREALEDLLNRGTSSDETSYPLLAAAPPVEAEPASFDEAPAPMSDAAVPSDE